MEIESQIILGLTSYKIISLVVGLVLAYLGYRLFMAGVWGEAGNFEAQFQDNKLILKKAAPGTFFALFGAIVICFTIVKGLEFDKYSGAAPKGQDTEKSQDENYDLPEELPF